MLSQQAQDIEFEFGFDIYIGNGIRINVCIAK